MRLLPVMAVIVSELIASGQTWAQITPVSVQMYGEGHATVTPPVGPPQSQNVSGQLTTLGQLAQYAPVGNSDVGPFASGSGYAITELQGGGYRFGTIAISFGKPVGSTTDSSGAADATFVFNIDSPCTMQLAMQFVINPPPTLAGGASTFFEFYGPDSSLIYGLHLN